MENNNSYNILRNEPYKGDLDKKGRFSYIPWANIWDKTKKNFPYVNHKVRMFTVQMGTNTLELPYCVLPDHTALVIVDISVTDHEGDEHECTMELAVRDQRNNAISNPDSVQVANTIRRCLAKGLSTLTGYGIELWAGEDIADLDYTKPTHLDGSPIVPGNATANQSIKLDELMRNRNIAKDVKQKLADIKSNGWNISENHAQILINDVSEGIRNAKSPTRTEITKAKKLIKEIDPDNKHPKRKDWDAFLENTTITSGKLKAFVVSLNNKYKEGEQ